MSGSGGGGGGFSSPEGTCDTLVIDTQLSSPKPHVIAHINKDDVLSIAVDATGGTATVVVLFNGEIAGGLAAPSVQRLRPRGAYAWTLSALSHSKSQY